VTDAIHCGRKEKRKRVETMNKMNISRVGCDDAIDVM